MMLEDQKLIFESFCVVLLTHGIDFFGYLCWGDRRERDDEAEVSDMSDVMDLGGNCGGGESWKEL